MAKEMGKPITAGIAEAEKCAWVCEFYADNAEQFLQERIIETAMSKSKVCYRPLGTIFAIMPWNFPFWQVFRFLCPNLMAGNAGLLSHAPISTGSAIAIDELLTEAGFPKDLFRSLIIADEKAEAVIAHPKVAGVTLTGSGRAGAIVAAQAGKNLKKVVLELGGSDPYVILEDADLDSAAQACVTSRMFNTGQVCIAAKRLIVVDAVKEEFEKLILEKISAYKMENALCESSNFGPMARDDLRESLQSQVDKAVREGAELILGGQIPEGPGFFYPPTVLRNVSKEMTPFTEELVGPVIALVPAKDEAEAIELANDTVYGLAAAVFTQDIEKGERIASDLIEAGTVNVNTFVGSDPRFPFGGIKQSGFGREISIEGIHEFVNIKTVSIA
jgi:succinate-semialdehyde dehydrogenase/glutarate-semialdehyde dehydrogenase